MSSDVAAGGGGTGGSDDDGEKKNANGSENGKSESPSSFRKRMRKQEKPRRSLLMLELLENDAKNAADSNVEDQTDTPGKDDKKVSRDEQDKEMKKKKAMQLRRRILPSTSK